MGVFTSPLSRGKSYLQLFEISEKVLSWQLCAPSLALDWQIKRLIEVEARVSYHARRWYVRVASAFPLAHHYRAVLAWGPLAPSQ
jgi:hypothetical protein